MRGTAPIIGNLHETEQELVTTLQVMQPSPETPKAFRLSTAQGQRSAATSPSEASQHPHAGLRSSRNCFEFLETRPSRDTTVLRTSKTPREQSEPPEQGKPATIATCCNTTVGLQTEVGSPWQKDSHLILASLGRPSAIPKTSSRPQQFNTLGPSI